MDIWKHNGQTIPDDLNKHGFVTVPDVLDYACQHHRQQPAFTSFGRTLSYDELDKLADAFAVYLQQETSLQPGDRIAIQLPNLIQYPIALFGAMRAGLVVVNTNPLYVSSEMEHQFSDSGAKALLIHKSMAHKAESILANTDIKYVFLTQIGDLHNGLKRFVLNAAIKYLKKMEPDFSIPGALPFRDVLMKYLGQKPKSVVRKSNDLAVLQYTGGTTGVAKGAMLTHANLLSNMLQAERRINQAGPNWPEVMIAPLPLYHIYAFTMSQVVALAGGHSVLIANPRDIPGFVKELAKWRITGFTGLNTLFVALCNHPDFRKLDFSRLQLTASGGMALTHAAAEQWQKVTGSDIVEGYGLTETSPAVSFNPPKAIRLGTIGLPVSHTEVCIKNAEGESLATGEVGELCVKGPQVMLGYWQNEAETRKAFTADGFFMTGDIAEMDEDGYLRIVDRAKDMIIVSGFNVYPNEVEDVACSHPEVLECAAIGLADEKCGEVVQLVAVRTDDHLTEEQVRDWCKQNLTGYKVPKRVKFVEELPKTPVGKVLRRALRT